MEREGVVRLDGNGKVESESNRKDREEKWKRI